MIFSWDVFDSNGAIIFVNFARRDSLRIGDKNHDPVPRDHTTCASASGTLEGANLFSTYNFRGVIILADPESWKFYTAKELLVNDEGVVPQRKTPSLLFELILRRSFRTAFVY